MNSGDQGQIQLVVRMGLEPATCGFQVRCSNHSATLPLMLHKQLLAHCVVCLGRVGGIILFCVFWKLTVLVCNLSECYNKARYSAVCVGRPVVCLASGIQPYSCHCATWFIIIWIWLDKCLWWGECTWWKWLHKIICILSNSKNISLFFTITITPLSADFLHLISAQLRTVYSVYVTLTYLITWNFRDTLISRISQF